MIDAISFVLRTQLKHAKTAGGNPQSATVHDRHANAKRQLRRAGIFWRIFLADLGGTLRTG
jgi:hypothetical protein